MHSINHTHSTTSAICQDCKMYLCPNCSNRYSILICNDCNQKRSLSEQQAIIHELITYGLSSCAAAAFLIWYYNSDWIQEIGSAWVLLISCIICGWFAGCKKLEKAGIHQETDTPVAMLNLLYYVWWWIIAALTGAIALPFRLHYIRKRLRQLKAIEKIIQKNQQQVHCNKTRCALQSGGRHPDKSLFIDISDN